MSENQINQNAVSVYGQEGLDDFPVLKAFQQYIDAEQIKSRKRMVLLSIFFAVLLTIVIAIFLLVLKDVSSKNQALNDRLIELVSKERDRQPVVVQQPAPAPVQQPANDAALKAMTETLVTLQKQLIEQQQQAKRAELPPPPAAVPEKPTHEQTTIQQKIDSDTEKLKKAQELLKAEKEKMAAEKERLRQQEIELHRRRLYPDYYERLDREAERPVRAPAAAKKPSATTRSAPALTAPANGLIDLDLDDDDDELDDDELDNINVDVSQFAPTTKKPAVKPKPALPAKPAAQPKPPKPQPKPAAPSKPAEPTEAAPTKPVEQPAATEPKPVTVPVEINGSESDWLIPVA